MFLVLDSKSVLGKIVSLTPGSHTARVTADGYQTEEKPFEVPQSGKTVSASFHLEPALPQLRVVSDLKAGQVIIDESNTGNLQEGSLLKGEIATGDHTLKIVADGKQLLAFSFHVTPGAAVTLTTPLQAANLPAVVVSSKGGAARIFSTAGLKASLAGQPQQTVPSIGLELQSVSAGGNDLIVSDGRTERHLVLDTTANPVLSIQVGAPPDTGTLLVQSNVPDAQISIDGAVLRKGLAGGSRLITLTPKSYTIKVFKEGYEDAQPQTAAITKGEQKILRFDLVSAVTKAALEISDLPTGTELLIDGQSAGSANNSGTLTIDVAPGKHKIILQNPGYETQPFTLDMRPGVNKVSASSYMSLAKSSLTIHVTPSTAKVTYRRSNDTTGWQVLGSASSVTLEPGDYTVNATADGYTQRIEQVTISPGKSSVLNLELVKVSVTPQSPFEDPESWKEVEHGWLLHEGPALAWLRNRTGQFEFVIYKQAKSGLFGKSKTVPIAWAVDWNDRPGGQPSLAVPASRIEYTFDGKQLRRRSINSSGSAKEQKTNVPSGSAPYFVLDLSVTSAQITVKIDGHDVDTVQRASQTAPVGKLGFRGPVQLSVRKAGSA
jgi:hypothetical protein